MRTRVVIVILALLAVGRTVERHVELSRIRRELSHGSRALRELRCAGLDAVNPGPGPVSPAPGPSVRGRPDPEDSDPEDSHPESSHPESSHPGDSVPRDSYRGEMDRGHSVIAGKSSSPPSALREDLSVAGSRRLQVAGRPPDLVDEPAPPAAVEFFATPRSPLPRVQGVVRVGGVVRARLLADEWLAEGEGSGGWEAVHIDEARVVLQRRSPPRVAIWPHESSP